MPDSRFPQTRLRRNRYDSWTRRLVAENRLYRQTALGTGDARVASVLDELEPLLLEIAHGPDRLTPEELEKLRQRIEGDGILFKVRVLGSTVRREETTVPRAGRNTL